MASATWNESPIITVLKEADLEEYEEICLSKGLKKVKHLKDVDASLLRRELGMEIIYVSMCGNDLDCEQCLFFFRFSPESDARARERRSRETRAISHARGHLRVSRFVRRTTEKRETARSLEMIMTIMVAGITVFLCFYFICFTLRITRFRILPNRYSLCTGIPYSPQFFFFREEGISIIFLPLYMPPL